MNFATQTVEILRARLKHISTLEAYCVHFFEYSTCANVNKRANVIFLSPVLLWRKACVSDNALKNI